MKSPIETFFFKIALTGVLIVFMATDTLSQPQGYIPVDDTAAIRKKIAETTHSIRTINTQFIQEKSISFLEEKIMSKGKMLFENPDKLRLEYTEPFTYLMIMNSGRMMTDNGSGKAEYDLRSNRLFGEINDLIISAVMGNILDNKNFVSTVFGNNEKLFIRLVPNDAELIKYISRIELYLNRSDNSVTELKITEPSEDYTLIRFTGKIINETISPEFFYLR